MIKLGIAVNEKGYRIGESHKDAKLSDHEIDLMRELRESDPKTWSYRRLAEKFEVAKSYAESVCKYRCRAQVPFRLKRPADWPTHN